MTEDPVSKSSQLFQRDQANASPIPNDEGLIEEAMKKRSQFFNVDREDSPAPIMLEPEHQLMERFQAALKQHLLRQRDKLNGQITELGINLKKTQKEEEEAGVRLFSLKQDLATQQKALQSRQQTLEGLSLEREEFSAKLIEAKEKTKTVKRLCDEEIKIENDMRLEMESLRAWEKQLTLWKEELDSGLAVNQRVSKKTEADRRKLLDEKRQLDMFIFRLTTEISKMESELLQLNVELDRKDKERELLNQTVADANADLQALMNDQKRLLGDWNAVAMAINQRDAAYTQVLKELSASEEAFRDLNTEIESFKKSSDEEINHNEQLNLMLSRAKKDLDNYSRQVRTLMKRKMDLERQVTTASDLVNQTERDLQAAQVQTLSRENELQNVQKELEDLTREKCRLEDESLTILLEQTANDKASMNLNRQVKLQRQKNREREIEMAELENKLSKLFLEVEGMKAITSRNQEILMEMNRDLDTKEMELAKVEADTKDIQNQIASKSGHLIILNRKIAELTANRAFANDPALSPLDMKIRDLEWKIRDLKKETDNLQTEWLVQQSHNVKLTQQRNEQLKEVSVLRKQVVVLDMKQMKMNQELEKERRVEAELLKSVASLQLRLTNLGSALANQSGQKEQVDRDLYLAQAAFVQSLKDSEREQMNLKAEIRELELQLEELSEEMLDTQREMLAWEKRIQLANETKQSIQREKSERGDIGQMRQEIHRMEVRYSQLKKVQEKLVTDLEQSVRRRETIVDEAEAKETRKTNSRINFQRKLDDIRNKVKQIRQEVKATEKVISEAETTQQELINKMNEKTEHLKKLEENAKEMERQLENGYLRKQQNLEILIRRQRKCKLYGLLKAGKYRPLHRNELALENEVTLAKNMNTNLTAVLESLIADFPSHWFIFTKTLYSLKPDPV